MATKSNLLFKGDQRPLPCFGVGAPARTYRGNNRRHWQALEFRLARGLQHHEEMRFLTGNSKHHEEQSRGKTGERRERHRRSSPPAEVK